MDVLTLFFFLLGWGRRYSATKHADWRVAELFKDFLEVFNGATEAFMFFQYAVREDEPFLLVKKHVFIMRFM